MNFPIEKLVGQLEVLKTLAHEHSFWEQEMILNNYNTVSPEDCEKAINLVFEIIEGIKENRETIYTEKYLERSLYNLEIRVRKRNGTY